MLQEKNKYEEWLTTIANTRLIYNTMEELEDMLDNHSIHNNGIKRCLTTPQRLRSAFRDLKIEVALMTDDNVSLDQLMEQYKEASDFYRAKLSRRADREKTARDILNYCYPPYKREGFGKNRAAIYAQIVKQDISVPILLMLLMKALPGYDSKSGDVTNMHEVYEDVMALLEHHTYQNTLIFNKLPVVTRARNEERKSRIMLYYYIDKVLNTYEAYADQEAMYDVATQAKELAVDFDLEGYWNECGGRLDSTTFWELKRYQNTGCYTATRWHKDADNRLTGIKYTWFLFAAEDGSLSVYMLHPEAIMHRIKDQRYADADQAWYTMNMPDEEAPGHLPLERALAADTWQPNLDLTRVDESSVIDTYNGWLETCQQKLEYKDCDYQFYPALRAITEEYLYIATSHEGEYFRVPKACHKGLERIQFGNNVGIMFMDQKQYIVFDEFSLFISAGRHTLHKYGITRARSIT